MRRTGATLASPANGKTVASPSQHLRQEPDPAVTRHRRGPGAWRDHQADQAVAGTERHGPGQRPRTGRRLAVGRAARTVAEALNRHAGIAPSPVVGAPTRHLPAAESRPRRAACRHGADRGRRRRPRRMAMGHAVAAGRRRGRLVAAKPVVVRRCVNATKQASANSKPVPATMLPATCLQAGGGHASRPVGADPCQRRGCGRIVPGVQPCCVFCNERVKKCCLNIFGRPHYSRLAVRRRSRRRGSQHRRTMCISFRCSAACAGRTLGPDAGRRSPRPVFCTALPFGLPMPLVLPPLSAVSALMFVAVASVPVYPGRHGRPGAAGR